MQGNEFQTFGPHTGESARGPEVALVLMTININLLTHT